MIGIVVVSHSQKLADGVLELAGQMTRGSVPMQAAGGIDDPDNPIGTDPMKVMAAVEAVATEARDGVLVIMDLGSALMSAETALDFLPDEIKNNVMLCSAPIVEGTMAAAVQASVGSSLKEVVAEADSALNVKIRQLAPVTGQNVASPAPSPAAPTDDAPTDNATPGELRLDMLIVNKLGLHARPAANLVSMAGTFASDIRIYKGEASASAKSINQVALLSVKNGDTIMVTISGPDAQEALDALDALHKDNFGERDEDVAPTSTASRPASATEDGLLAGEPGSQGYAVGPAHVHEASLPQVERREVSDLEQEIRRLDLAISDALADIRALQKGTEKTSGKSNAAIFDVHALILEDRDMRDKAAAAISERKINAEFAWAESMYAMADAYKKLDDTYMQARAVDVLDCGGRVLRLLTGEEAQSIRLNAPSILVVHDLAPSDVAGLDTDMVLGVVTEVGGTTSHAAILSRSMGIPAVIGAGEGVKLLHTGHTIALDGFTGTVWPEPDEATRSELENKRTQWLADREEIKARGAAPATTLDGRDITVMGNIGVPSDATRVREFGGEGVGLFRTEFLFLDRREAPDEEEQFAAYVQAARALQGAPVIIRTLDIGGDKPVAYLDTPEEDNPFLGERGVRFCLARPDLFSTQLRALLRAASQENIRIMYPMISCMAELAEVLTLQNEVRKELLDKGRNISGCIPTGIMIEIGRAHV